jgi:putative ABC transport system permease protein
VMHSFWKLTQVDLGFRRDHVLTFRLPVNFNRFAQPEKVTSFYRPLMEKISNLPGIESVAASSGTPLAWSGWGMPFSIAGQPVDDPSKLPGTRLTLVTQDYFRTFGIPILRGRPFSVTDAEGGLPVAIVNEAFARKFLSNVDPLKQRLVIRRLGLATMGPPVEWNIVGVSRDVRNRGMRDDSAAEVMIPLWQEPQPYISVSVRTHGDPSTMANSVAAVVRSADPDLAMDNVRTMDQVVDESLGGDRFVTYLFAGFASVALVLAAIGIYGVMSFAVAQRTQEIGVRMALGATSREVQRMVLREGMGLALGGLVIGLAGAFVVGRMMKSLLYGVSSTDPSSVGGVALVLLTTAALACYVPARRATRVDAMVALRYE